MAATVEVEVGTEFTIKGIKYKVTSIPPPWTGDSGTVTVTGVADNAKIKFLTISQSIEYEDTIYNITSIKEKAFENCASLVEVTILANLTSIGTNAFYGCKNLVKFEVMGTNTGKYYTEQGILYQDKSLFCFPAGANHIYSYTVPNEITAIGANAFCNCLNLVEIRIHENVGTIGDQAFAGCERLFVVRDFTSGTLSKNALGSSSSVKIVDNYEDYQIQTADNITDLFKGSYPSYIFYKDMDQNRYICLGYIDQELETSVTPIGPLTIALPSLMDGFEVTHESYDIGPNAFINLKRLNNVILPPMIYKIQTKAFYDLKNLYSIQLSKEAAPSNIYLEEIGEEAFSGCENLSKFFSQEKGRFEIIETLKFIGNKAFSKCLSMNIFNIASDKYFFKIGSNILEGCINLSTLQMPIIGSKYSKIFSNDTTATTLNYFFGKNTPTTPTPTNLTVTIYKGLLAEQTFKDCGYVKEVILPKWELLEIPEACFEGTGLTIFTIPESVQKIGARAFANCTDLVRIETKNGLLYPHDVSKDNSGALYQTTDKVKIFEGCNKLKFITLPSYFIQHITNKSQLTSIEINDSEGELYDLSKAGLWHGVQACKSIPAEAFAVCSNADCSNADCSKVHCSNLEYVTLSDHIINIGEKAFYGCELLKEINIPNQVTTISVDTFNGCTYLPAITIPNGVNKIEDGAFTSCSSLQKVVIGEGITHIGSSQDGIGVFTATGLKEVVLPTLKTWCNIEFQKPADNPLYHIGAFPLDETNELVLSGEIVYVKPYTFAGCENIHKVSISRNIRNIEENSFFECNNIKLVQYSGSGYNWNRYIKDSTLKSPLVQKNFTLKQNTADTDFLGFTFNGKHSYYDLKLVRTIDGDRFITKMNPTSKDVTVEVPGGDGQYYFGTFHTNTQFTIKFAFEELDEEGFLLLKQVYQNKQMSDLIFDETPYKVYSAKVTGDNSLNYIPFSINGKRVYRGEGTLQFTCYYPYAHTPNRNTKQSEYFSATGTFEKDGRLIDDYDEWLYPTKQEWKQASRLSTITGVGENHGDTPTHFKFICSELPSGQKRLQVGKVNIDFNTNVPSNGYIIWDSKTGLVYTEDPNKNQSLIPYNGNSCGAIPVGGTNTVRIQQYDSDKKIWQDWARIEDNIWKKYDTTKKQWTEWTETSHPVLEYDYWYY